MTKLTLKKFKDKIYYNRILCKKVRSYLCAFYCT